MMAAASARLREARARAPARPTTPASPQQHGRRAARGGGAPAEARRALRGQPGATEQGLDEGNSPEQPKASTTRQGHTPHGPQGEPQGEPHATEQEGRDRGDKSAAAAADAARSPAGRPGGGEAGVKGRPNEAAEAAAPHGGREAARPQGARANPGTETPQAPTHELDRAAPGPAHPARLPGENGQVGTAGVTQVEWEENSAGRDGPPGELPNGSRCKSAGHARSGAAAGKGAGAGVAGGDWAGGDKADGTHTRAEAYGRAGGRAGSPGPDRR